MTGGTKTSDRPEVLAGVEDVDCRGRTVLVTGSTAGIGREIALALGRLGAAVIVHGRDAGKGREVVEKVEAAGGEATLRTADFASQDSVRNLADAVADHAPIDVLVNNAGAFFREPGRTEEGFERTFGVNHLAPFLLTSLLRPHLADGGRVVTTASDAHRRVDGLDLGSVRSTEEYSGFTAYSRSKLANVLFTRALDRRLEQATAVCFHPGFVPGSELFRELPLPVRVATWAIDRLPSALVSRIATTVAEGAATGVYLAVGRIGADAGGEYFRNQRRSTPSPAARDGDLAERLWERSLEWTGLAAEID